MIIDALQSKGVHVFLVDDGSAAKFRQAIAGFHSPKCGVEVLCLNENGGKGCAVRAGLEAALKQNFTHAIQVDADGQHDLASLDILIETSRSNQAALISGKPIYDDTIPRSRRISRWLTHVWVWVETLSTEIKDSMCGFRVYPIEKTLDIMKSEPVGRRMDFDTEIMVRMSWHGTPVIYIPVAVTYPEGNTSNFRLFHDNWLITRMHTRLFFGMLARLPMVWRNRPRPDVEVHWASMGERGAYLGLQIVLFAYRWLGRRACILLLWPIVTYFFARDKERRGHSLAYLRRIATCKGQKQPGWRQSHAHFMSFAVKALDTAASWGYPERSGELEIQGGAEAKEIATSGKGALLIVSHLGNAELCRAQLAEHLGKDVHVLMHTTHARLYNKLVRAVRPDAGDFVIEVTDINPSTIIALSQKIENGDWVVIAGDRIPVSGTEHTGMMPFLGTPAPFSHGPYIMAALLGCPVILMFCMQEGSGHIVIFEEFAERITLPRSDRLAHLNECAARYASRLESHCLKWPLQWYNFYDFWGCRNRDRDISDTAE